MRIFALTRAGLLAATIVASPFVLAADQAPHSMTGCLRAGSAPGSWELTDLGLADGPKSVAIVAASVDLSGHVGHKIEITGTTVETKDAGTHAMNITAMKHIAASCP